MTFFHILKSLDELLYEIMSWLIFFPVTLWRAVRHPLQMMEYAKREIQKDDGKFRETLSPPIFLLVTIILSHAPSWPQSVTARSSPITRVWQTSSTTTPA